MLRGTAFIRHSWQRGTSRLEFDTGAEPAGAGVEVSEVCLGRTVGPTGGSQSGARDPTGPANTAFHVHPGGWPAGGYEVEILVNDRLAETREFTVRQGH